ncbi:Dynamin-1 [Manis pentadactyla]|nr:Dynamin-1 [Manis pentadactyla]
MLTSQGCMENFSLMIGCTIKDLGLEHWWCQPGQLPLSSWASPLPSSPLRSPGLDPRCWTEAPQVPASPYHIPPGAQPGCRFWNKLVLTEPQDLISLLQHEICPHLKSIWFQA